MHRTGGTDTYTFFCFRVFQTASQNKPTKMNTKLQLAFPTVNELTVSWLIKSLPTFPIVLYQFHL